MICDLYVIIERVVHLYGIAVIMSISLDIVMNMHVSRIIYERIQSDGNNTEIIVCDKPSHASSWHAYAEGIACQARRMRVSA
jgi:hypothetical protein